MGLVGTHGTWNTERNRMGGEDHQQRIVTARVMICLFEGKRARDLVYEN